MEDFLEYQEQLHTGKTISQEEDQDLIEIFEGEDAKLTVLEEEKIKALKGVKLPIKEHRELVIHAKIGQAGKVNRNGRIYPLPIMSREVTRLSEKIKNRSVFSNDQHPRRKVSQDKKTVEMVDLPNWGSQAFIPLTIEMNEQGEVYSTGVVPKTDSGRNFAAIIRAGGSPGFSTRGAGTVKKQKISVEEGKEREVLVVQDNFRLLTFDTVIDQSVEDATVKSVTESSEAKSKGQIQSHEQVESMKFNQWIKKYSDAFSDLKESFKSGDISLDDVKSDFNSLYETLRKSIAEELEKDVQSKLLEQYGEYLDSIRSELSEQEQAEIQAEGIISFCEELGINGDDVKALIEKSEVPFGEIFRTLLEELSEGGGQTDKSNTDTNEATTMELSEAIANDPTVKELKEKSENLEKQLLGSQIQKRIFELKASFPYGNKLFDDHISPLLEGAETLENVDKIYDNQINLLKAGGAKETPKGQSKFLAETDEDTDPGNGSEEDLSEDEQLISESAVGMPGQEVNA